MRNGGVASFPRGDLQSKKRYVKLLRGDAASFRFNNLGQLIHVWYAPLGRAVFTFGTPASGVPS
jgi:hypothetical protein